MSGSLMAHPPQAFCSFSGLYLDVPNYNRRLQNSSCIQHALLKLGIVCILWTCARQILIVAQPLSRSSIEMCLQARERRRPSMLAEGAAQLALMITSTERKPWTMTTTSCSQLCSLSGRVQNVANAQAATWLIVKLQIACTQNDQVLVHSLKGMQCYLL